MWRTGCRGQGQREKDQGYCNDPVKDKRDSVQSGSGRGGEMCPDSGCILKKEPEGFLKSFNTSVTTQSLNE